MNPTERNFDSVIFDLDGTLLDSLEDIAIATNQVLSERGFPTHPVPAFKQLVGDGVMVLFERALPSSTAQDAELIRQCAEGFKVVYEDQWHQNSQPYAGILDMLDRLQQAQLQLGVLSNKPHPFTIACVERFFPTIAWTHVLGNREDMPRKPDPAGVHAILAQANSTPAKCLYVGDTNTDMLTARSAGCCAVGVSWGFREAQELRDAGADHIIDQPAQLIELAQV